MLGASKIIQCLSKLTDKSLLLVINLSTTVIFKLFNTSCSLLVLCILIIISVILYNYNFNNCRLLQFSSDRDNMEWKMVSFWERNFALMPPPPPPKKCQKNWKLLLYMSGNKDFFKKLWPFISSLCMKLHALVELSRCQENVTTWT